MQCGGAAGTNSQNGAKSVCTSSFQEPGDVDRFVVDQLTRTEFGQSQHGQTATRRSRVESFGGIPWASVLHQTHIRASRRSRSTLTTPQGTRLTGYGDVTFAGGSVLEIVRPGRAANDNLLATYGEAT